MVINRIMVTLVIILQLFGCREHQGQIQESIVDSTKKDSFKPIVPENSVQVPIDSVFLKKPLIDCKLMHNQEQQEEDFINSNIQFFEVKSLPDQQFINEEYCRFILKNTNFLSFLESNFLPGNFEFTHFYTNIDNYGKCFVGKYYFSAADNSAQRRAIIILQMEKKEFSILNFDDVKFVDGKLNCDFNVRGKHFIYKLRYSNECKRFIN
jgi:hypothetical protein